MDKYWKRNYPMGKPLIMTLDEYDFEIPVISSYERNPPMFETPEGVRIVARNSRSRNLLWILTIFISICTRNIWDALCCIVTSSRAHKQSLWTTSAITNQVWFVLLTSRFPVMVDLRTNGSLRMAVWCSALKPTSPTFVICPCFNISLPLWCVIPSRTFTRQEYVDYHFFFITCRIWISQSSGQTIFIIIAIRRLEALSVSPSTMAERSK